MKAIHIGPAALAVLLVVGSPAPGKPREGTYLSATSGPWHELGTWVLYDSSHRWRLPTLYDSPPGPTSRVIIAPGHTVTVTGEREVEQVVIGRSDGQNPPGTLDISAGSQLQIRDGLVMARKPRGTASARLVFSGGGGSPGVLQSQATLDIYGDVEVVGPAGGMIRTAKPTQLICVGRFARLIASGGPLWVGGAVSMDGQVIADGPYAVTLDGSELRKGSSGLWRIAHPQASVRIATKNPVALRGGRIVIDEGRLDVDTDLTVGGVVTRGPEGVIKVREGRSFDVIGRLVEQKAQQFEGRGQQ